ncbi:MAG: N-acetylneuraminate lyase [Betaproteobacteria bacterium]|nr:N-acetylneuraminate lyase [Betaproteobacteria bacterium]
MSGPFSVIAAAFTPFGADGVVDTPVIQRQIERLVDEKVDGAFICGTTGEGSSLTGEERQNVAAAWVAGAPSGFRVIVHVGHAAPMEARALAAHAASIGADSVAAVVPYFVKPRNAAEAVDALAIIAAGAPRLPFFYYHIPMLTGTAIPAASIVREARARIPNFAGVKFTDVDLNDLGNVIDECGDTLEVFYGRDDFLLPAMSLGVRQAVGMTYNYTGPIVRALVAAFDRGDLATARAAQAPIRRLIAASAPHGIINVLKGLAPAVGVSCGPTRAPLTDLPPEQLQDILAATGIEAALRGAGPVRLAA